MFCGKDKWERENREGNSLFMATLWLWVWHWCGILIVNVIVSLFPLCNNTVALYVSVSSSVRIWNGERKI